MANEATRRGKRSKTRVTRAIREQEAGNEPLSKHWREDFLAALAETSNITQSAKIAGVSTARAYKVRREEPDFRRKWFQALSEGYDHLEMEVLRRLREGDFATTEGPKFDFASALRVLGAHQQSVSTQKALQNNMDEEAVLQSITMKIDALRLAHKQTEQPAMIEIRAAKRSGKAGGRAQ